MTDTANALDLRGDAPLLPDPSPCLTAAYRSIAQRMDGLTFVNPAIEVEAVGFAPWESHWLGVMVTPWCINLMLLPRDASAWTSLPQGQKLSYRFPAGDYDFISSRDETVGEYQMCSLISPVLETPGPRHRARGGRAGARRPARSGQCAGARGDRPGPKTRRRRARSRRSRSRPGRR